MKVIFPSEYELKLAHRVSQQLATSNAHLTLHTGNRHSPPSFLCKCIDELLAWVEFYDDLDQQWTVLRFQSLAADYAVVFPEHADRGSGLRLNNDLGVHKQSKPMNWRCDTPGLLIGISDHRTTGNHYLLFGFPSLSQNKDRPTLCEALKYAIPGCNSPFSWIFGGAVSIQEYEKISEFVERTFPQYDQVRFTLT
jgi:hypothetical protein